jgi:hypothetical protein
VLDATVAATVAEDTMGCVLASKKSISLPGVHCSPRLLPAVRCVWLTSAQIGLSKSELNLDRFLCSSFFGQNVFDAAFHDQNATSTHMVRLTTT